jgi:hypothetical protein
VAWCKKRAALKDTTGADTNNLARLLQILIIDVGIQVFYFTSPPAYRGSRIGSYGSSIKYNITYYGDVAAGTLTYKSIIPLRRPGDPEFVQFLVASRIRIL